MKYEYFKWYKYTTKEKEAKIYYYFPLWRNKESRIFGLKYIHDPVRLSKDWVGMIYYQQLNYELEFVMKKATKKEITFLKSKTTSDRMRKTVRSIFGEDLDPEEWR